MLAGRVYQGMSTVTRGVVNACRILDFSSSSLSNTPYLHPYNHTFPSWSFLESLILQISCAPLLNFFFLQTIDSSSLNLVLHPLINEFLSQVTCCLPSKMADPTVWSRLPADLKYHIIEATTDMTTLKAWSMTLKKFNLEIVPCRRQSQYLKAA